MSEESKKQFDGGFNTRKYTLTGIDEVQFVYLDPGTSFKNEVSDGWEVRLHEYHYKTAFICLSGEKTEITNKMTTTMVMLVIKGHGDYQYAELDKFFKKLGFSVQHGPLTMCD